MAATIDFRRHIGVWLIAGVLTGSVRCVSAPDVGRAAAAVLDRAIEVRAVSVPLNHQNPAQTSVGPFHYAGGLALTSPDTDELHGLSDLFVADRDRLTAVGDEGILLHARLVLDDAEQLVGLTDARIAPLIGEDGSALPDKTEADAEGLAQLPGGDRLVSFERHHRIWLYPATGLPPRPVPAPEAVLPSNGGMEALAAVPDAGADAYVVGAERSGDTWTCRVSGGCSQGPSVDKPAEFGLVAMSRLPGARTAYLLRAFDPGQGNRITLQIVGSAGLVARMDMARPMTIDNFEGLAAVPRSDGTVRFYMLSDDNVSATQRTLLLAFDWRPRALPGPGRR